MSDVPEGSRPFYVYRLVDDRDGAVFYIGKGSGNRVARHELDARRGAGGPKCERIREIWAAGSRVRREIVQRFAREVDALRYEEALIAEIGLESLTNIAPGGRGRRLKRPWTEQAVAGLVPNLQRALWRMIQGDGRLYVGDIDATGAVLRIVTKLHRELGAAAFDRVMGLSLGAA
jgi:hypothetical protein